MTRSPESPATGVPLAAAGAVSYGVTVVIGRSLARSGLDSATALGIRFGIAALLLLGLARALRAPLRPRAGERVRILLLGAVGYTTESMLFYLALERGTAAACILLFYAYPAIVSAIEIARGKERPSSPTLVALALSVVGTVVVVAARGDVSIGPIGISLALASATVYAAYLVIGRELGRRSDPVTTACWMATGAAASSLVRGAATGGLTNPHDHLAMLFLYGFATALAFALTFAALKRLGTARTAVIGTLEAFSAILLGAAFLGERITAVQALGGAVIVLAAAVIALAPSAAAPRPSRPALPAPSVPSPDAR